MNNNYYEVKIELITDADIADRLSKLYAILLADTTDANNTIEAEAVPSVNK
jgi:hypothetical protein